MSTPPAFRLVRQTAPGAGAALPDPTHDAVVAHRRGDGPLVVLGAPGTGKTTVLVRAVATRIDRDGVDPARVLVLAPSRTAAADLRDRVTGALDRTVTEPLARTPHAYAFALLRRAAVAAGEPPPRLISGPEQDRVLADLLAGHAAGAGRRPQWPTAVEPALGLRGLRDELRDLLMRALERGLGPADLDALGRRTGRPEWRAAATVLAEYLDVTALASPGAYDPAAILDAAGALLAHDPDLLRTERDRWQLVAVDDHHESGEALARLLDLLCGGGADLLLTGDPDATTQSFRGGDPALVAGAADRYRRADGHPGQLVRLGTRWRPSAAVHEATARVAATVGAVGQVDHRGAGAPPDGRPDGSVRAAVLRSATQEGAYVAHVLRRAHLVDQVPWSAMAVIVRSAGRTGALRRALGAAGVPVAVPAAQVPVRDEPAVRPFRSALRVALHPDALDTDTAVDLLTGPLGGADALALRRLRQALRAEDRDGGGSRASDVLLVEALADPAHLVSLPSRTAEPATRVARVLRAGRQAAAAPAATAETVLWALWEASGLAGPWRRRALGGGPAGARADRDLDAVVALFDAAARFVDRLPGSGPAEFLAHLDAQDVPADTLAERAAPTGAVSLLTAQGAVGQEWDLVVLAGMQEGVWPDLRLRGSLLGAQALVDVVTGRDPDGTGTGAGARAQVLADERRLLHVAVSRARRDLVVTAVRDADERPSAFLDLIDPLPVPAAGAVGGPPPERRHTVVPRPVTLPALVSELRQVLLSADGAVDGSGRTVTAARRSAAAHQLARLAAADVPGAHPRDWYGLADWSHDGPLVPDGEPVRVSPSSVDAFGRCPLRWLLESAGGQSADSTSQGVGSLVHDVAADLPDGTQDELAALLEQRWSTLGLPDTWIGARAREGADEMVRRLAQYLGTRQRELVAVEEAFTVTVGRAQVSGRVDRLERDSEGRLVVVDLKTGSTAPAKADVPRHAQLGAYQVAVQEGGFAEHGDVSGGAALVQVGGKNTRFSQLAQPPLVEDDDTGWAHRLLLETADGMAGATFDAVRHDLCRTCPVLTSCPLQPPGRHVGAAPVDADPADTDRTDTDRTDTDRTDTDRTDTEEGRP